MAVGLLIWAGMQKSKYDLSELTYIARRSDLGADLPPNAVVKSPEQVRAEHLMGVACGVIMLLATIVFLVWGFVPLFDQIGGWGGIDKFALEGSRAHTARAASPSAGSRSSWAASCAASCAWWAAWRSKSKDDWIAEAAPGGRLAEVRPERRRHERPVETRLRGIQTLAEPRAHPKPRKALLEVAGLFSLLWTLHNKENDRILITAMR